MPSSRKRILVLVIVLALSAASAAGAVVLDRFLSRPDRIAATARVDDMIMVRDQVLRFELETGVLPRSLDELVGPYVRSDEILRDGEPIFRLDPGARTLSQVEGSTVKGLIAHAQPPVVMELPPAGPEVLQARRGRLEAVRDGILRYKASHGVLPRSFEEAGSRFLDGALLSRDGVALYVYDAKGATLSEDPAWFAGRMGGEFAALKVELNAEPSTGHATVSREEVPDLFEDGIAIIPEAPTLDTAPEGAMVFEAELFNQMNWGWEVRRDPSVSGGAYLHSWEGTTNGPAQLNHDVWHFFDVQTKPRDYTAMRYYFHVPKTGTWYIYGRLWTTDTHCSNSVNVDIDDDTPDSSNYMGNTTPFRWLWTAAGGRGHYLKEGDHYLHVFIHEDGVRLDQFVISPQPIRDRDSQSSKPYRANYVAGQDTAWRTQAGPSLHVSFDLASQVISPGSPPDCRVALRKLRDVQGKATLRVTLDHAGTGGQSWQVGEFTFDLAKLPELCMVPLSFDGLDLGALPLREYLLRAEVVASSSPLPPGEGRVREPLASTRVTLLRPWEWEVAGPLRYMRNGERGPLDERLEPKAGDKLQWKRIDEKHLDHFGVLDFGLHTSGSSLHAPEYQTIYARTRVHVPADGTYLFLIQTDDQMLLWLDGKLIYRYDDDNYMPVTRSARRYRVPLTVGDHELRMRVNQTITRWQATIRIRTENDLLSEVTGIPMGAQ